MGPLTLIALIAGLSLFGFFLGRWKSIAMAGSGAPLHSRPNHYGSFVLVWTAVPALVVLTLLVIARPLILDQTIRSHLPSDIVTSGDVSLAISGVEQVADGLKAVTPDEYENIHLGVVSARRIFADHGIPLGGDVSPYQLTAAIAANDTERLITLTTTTAVVGALALGLFLAFIRIKPRLRARNSVERVVLTLLIAASTVAILTTVGIVLSLLFQALQFFSVVSPINFYFGTVWDPRFAAAGATASAGQFGLIPLLAGTLYIGFVAMLVAVPVGLFAAIYMSEYASRTVRSIAKPLLEVLAGIPTIVYGFFALITVGPFLRDISAQLNGLVTGNYSNFIQAQSVLTAGFVMGIMLIPYVSSLSDDIITAVPRALRDGSLGLGATRSETIKRVILPAALPGIVGALLMTASRAIGETMIVVLAAGVAARMQLNPFEPMTTVTVKIVNQLTGDLEFTSPQTLVAFALGITLFVITLCLNIYALYIVRKYREQYE